MSQALAHDALAGHLAQFEQHTSRPDVTDLVINGPGRYHLLSGAGWETVECAALDAPKLRAMALAVAGPNNARIQPERPLLAGTTAHGWRAYVVGPPVVEHRTIAALAFRLPSRQLIPFDALVAGDLFRRARHHQPARLPAAEGRLLELYGAGQWADFVRLAIESRLNLVVSGHTGSGKTTLSKAVIQLIGRRRRIVTIEDVRELLLPEHPNVVHLLYDSDGGTGAASAERLLDACNRLIPDRVLFQEIRGGRMAMRFVQSMFSIPGALTTVHGADPDDAFALLAGYCLQTDEGRSLGRDEVQRQLRATVDVVIQMDAIEAHEQGVARIERGVTDIYFDPQRKRRAKMHDKQGGQW